MLIVIIIIIIIIIFIIIIHFSFKNSITDELHAINFAFILFVASLAWLLLYYKL